MPSRHKEALPAEENLPTPLIIPRDAHPISRKDIDREALKVMHRLRDAGFSAYLVGGAVRDLYLGKTPKDFDISTNARPGQLRTLFRNSRIIGRRFRLVQVFFHGGKIIEVSTLRCQSEFDDQEEDEVLAHNNTFGTEAEDAFRRDLTINALFYEIENFTIIDYTGGVADLDNRIVRLVGEPERRIIRDPVRMLRAIRHAARTGFAIEEKTWQAVMAQRETLRLCPDSRIRDELFKDLRSGASAPWLELAVASGLVFILFPCYDGMIEQADQEGDQVYALLLSICRVIDRLHTQETPLPEELLFTLLLLPWGLERFNLREYEARGKEAVAFFQNLRGQVEAGLEHLNIKRAIKEEVCLLLSNFPVFFKHGKGQPWPGWLKKKSYYPDGLLLFSLYQEAAGGSPVPAASLPEPPAATPRQRPERKKESFRSHRGEARTPAFSRKKGGVFGLK